MRTFTTGVVTVGFGIAAMATGAVAGTSDGQGAQKTALVRVDGDQNSCDNSGGGAGSATGFAILNAPGKVGSVSKIVGEVSLKNAEPNTAFEVDLAMDGTCTPAAMLTTNTVGNGNAHINIAFGSASQYWVVLRNVSNGAKQEYVSGAVALK